MVTKTTEILAVIVIILVFTFIVLYGFGETGNKIVKALNTTITYIKQSIKFGTTIEATKYTIPTAVDEAYNALSEAFARFEADPLKTYGCVVTIPQNVLKQDFAGFSISLQDTEIESGYATTMIILPPNKKQELKSRIFKGIRAPCIADGDALESVYWNSKTAAPTNRLFRSLVINGNSDMSGYTVSNILYKDGIDRDRLCIIATDAPGIVGEELEMNEKLVNEITAKNKIPVCS